MGLSSTGIKALLRIKRYSRKVVQCDTHSVFFDTADFRIKSQTSFYYNQVKVQRNVSDLSR